MSTGCVDVERQYTRVRPSGLITPALTVSAARSASTGAPLKSEFRHQSELPPGPFDAYSTRFPSGVHSGRELRSPSDVSFVGVPDAMSWIQTSLPLLDAIAIANLVPSGENRGAA